MDLLSVLMHEVGHLLGHDHVEGGVMNELAAGTRTAFSSDGWLIDLAAPCQKPAFEEWLSTGG